MEGIFSHRNPRKGVDEELLYLHSAAVKLKKIIIHFIYLFRFISLFGYEGHLLSEAN